MRKQEQTHLLTVIIKMTVRKTWMQKKVTLYLRVKMEVTRTYHERDELNKRGYKVREKKMKMAMGTKKNTCCYGEEAHE